MDYLEALDHYMLSDQFRLARRLMEKSGITRLAATNVLSEAFYHGWKCHHDTPADFQRPQLNCRVNATAFVKQVEALLRGGKNAPKNASHTGLSTGVVYRNDLTPGERRKLKQK